MEKYLAMLIVAAVAAAFYGVSYLKKRKLYPVCDRFAEEYCGLADRLLGHRSIQQSLATETLDGGLFRIQPIQNQPEEIQEALKSPIDDTVLASVRSLFLLRDEIQAQASNGSFSKEKYNAITNQIFDSLNSYLSIVQDQTQFLSQNDLDQFHYMLHKQKHIRNTTLAAIVSRSCAARIA